MYYGEIGSRYTLNLTLKKEYTFMSYFTYRGEENHLYTFEDTEGNVFVWKTTAIIGMDIKRPDGHYDFDGLYKGDTAVIKATVKDHREYKGTEQTVLTRCKVMSIDHVETYEEKLAKKRKEQLDSLQGEDFVWRMPYRQYKEHYADCETIAGSYDDGSNDEYILKDPTIEVIVREGRLVPSGVRGQHYSGYEFIVDGVRHVYRAVNEENAERRCRKDYPDAKTIEYGKIYQY